MIARVAFPLGGTLLVASWAAIALLGPKWQHPVLFVALYGTAFAGYILPALLVRHQKTARLAPAMLIGIGLAARAVALPMQPSDDIHRYLWEARVQRAGFNPYESAPTSPELARLARDDPDWPLINHPDWPAIYPPAAQLWNRALGRGVTALKLSFVAAELLALAGMSRLLAARGLSRDRLLIYWWNPLTIFAFACEGHLDAVSVALLVLALAALETNRSRVGVMALAGATLAKGFAIAVLPVYLRRVQPSRWLWGAGLAICLAIPFSDAGTDLLASMTRFGAEMSYNDSLHAVIEAVVALGGLPPGASSRAAAAGVWLALAIFVWRRPSHDPLRDATFLVGALLLLLPTAHAWYFTIILPLLCVIPWTGWILVSGTLILPFLAQTEIAVTGQWVEWHGVKWIAYAPVYGWLLGCLVIRLRGWRGVPRADERLTRSIGERD